MQPVILRCHEPSAKRVITLGQLNIGKRGPVYRYNIPREDEMLALSAWGVCPAVLDAMLAEGIDIIEFWRKDSEFIFTTTRQHVLKHGILESFGGRPKYWHLAKREWQLIRHYRLPWIPATQSRTLVWVDHKREPEKPRAEQMSLF